MTDLEKSQWLIRLVRQVEADAVRSYCGAEATRVGMVAAANVWDENRPDDGIGGMSQNPYARGVDTGGKSSMDARSHMVNAKDLVDFTINRLLKLAVTT